MNSILYIISYIYDIIISQNVLFRNQIDTSLPVIIQSINKFRNQIIATQNWCFLINRKEFMQKGIFLTLNVLN